MATGHVQPKRGDIWLCDLNPTRGHEQAGTRPVYVLAQADKTLSIVLPISQGITLARSLGFAVTLSGTGLRTQGVIICNQPRTVSLKERNGKRIEVCPSYITDEVLARLSPLVT